MKQYLLLLAVIFSFIAGFQGVSQAITVTASPSPATVNQSVTITVTSTYIPDPGLSCNIAVNFGDGSPQVILPTCTLTPCTRTTTHAYTTPGIYTITAGSVIGACVIPPFGPDPATTSLTVQCTNFNITSPGTLPAGTVNQSYSYQVQASGGQTPYAYNIISGSLPSGLTLSSSGLISGTSTVSGIFNFVVQGTDSCSSGAQTFQRQFSLTVNAPPCPSLNIISPSVLTSGIVGQSYNYQIQATGGQSPTTFSVVSGSMPTGLNLNTSGLLSGTPTASGSSNFTISVIDSCPGGVQTAQRNFSITVNVAPCPTLTITSPSVLPSNIVGQPYNYQIKITGGQTPTTFSLASGSLPQGLNINASGFISGTPTTAGTSNFTISATDSCPGGAQTDQANFSLTVNFPPCTPLNISSPSVLPSGTKGQSYNYQTQATGGQSPITFSLASGSLPMGLNLNISGLISGTPTATGTFNFTIRAIDSCQAGVQTSQSIFSLTINSPAVRIMITPSSFNISRGIAQTGNVFYTLSTPSMMGLTLTSNRGIFSANTSVIGEVNTPLSVVISGGSGSVSEALNLSVTIIKRAEQLNTSRIIYTRTFTDGTVSVTGQIEIIVTTGAGAEFQITRLQLYFKNQRAEITVNRNQTFLKAFADIRFSGSGLLTGYWEVDGRILEYVNQHLVYGKSITLVSPKVPSLPTYSPGTHIVRFVISQPSRNIPIPQALYFVTAEETREIRSIELIMPEDHAGIGYSPVAFDWQNVTWADTYIIVFFDNPDEKPIFSAYTRENSYRLPPLILNSLFVTDGVYQWQVKGYDGDGNIIGESALYRFVFLE